MRVLEAFGEPILSGGQESFVFGILENINMENLSIDCLTAYYWENTRYRQIIEKAGGSAYELNLPFHPGKSRMNIAIPFRRFLQNHPYDVIHIHSGSISVLAIMAEEADKAGVSKVIVHSHSTGVKDNWRHKLLRFLASQSMRRHVDIYCACSKEAAYWKFVPRFAQNAVIIKNGVDTERFRYNPLQRKECRKRLGFSTETYVIGHVGRFSHEKNQQFLVQVFKELLQKEPTAKLLLVGDGEERAATEKLVETLHLTEKVIMTGNVNNVYDYLQVMDVFVLPSYYEGFPIVAMEAQAVGLPAVISDSVTQDIKITNDIVFLSLNQTPYSAWVETILRFKTHRREDNALTITNAGYDVKNTAEFIRNMYLCNTDKV